MMERIEQPAPSTQPSAQGIDSDAEAAVRRYIDAIVARDAMAESLGPAYRDAEAQRLWMVFLSRYGGLISGAYAKPAKEALRIALSGI
jgi:hypothetical protein